MEWNARMLCESIFVVASQQKVLDTRSMTRSVKWVLGGRSKNTSRGSSSADYDAFIPPEGGPVKARSLTASSLTLLDKARWRTSVCYASRLLRDTEQNSNIENFSGLLVYWLYMCRCLYRQNIKLSRT